MNGADIWGDEDAGSGDERQRLDREWQARREEHYSGGYREGLEAGKHETVQEGFNAGYAQGTAAGFECGAARGAAATLRALAPRLPDLASRLQDMQLQEQHAGGQQQQPRQLEDVPYQQLQQRVCETLMAAAALPHAGQQVRQQQQAGLQQQPLPSGDQQQHAAPASAPGAQQVASALPPDVGAALQSTRSTLQLLGLQVPAQKADC